MTGSRRRSAWIASGALLALGVAVVSRTAGGPAAVAAGEPSSESVPPSEPAAGRPARHPARVDIARVEAALARAKATTTRITRERIVEEQRRMAEAKARFEAIRLPEPEQRQFTDAHGTRWVELHYESGEVRYQLAPDPEPPPSGEKR